MAVVAAKIVDVRFDLTQIDRFLSGAIDTVSASAINQRGSHLQQAAREIDVPRAPAATFRDGDTLADVEAQRLASEQPTQEEMAAIADADPPTVPDAAEIQQVDQMATAAQEAQNATDQVANEVRVPKLFLVIWSFI